MFRTILVSGGFEDEQEVRSSSAIDVEPLRATHEEADTRLILHAVNSRHKRVVLSAGDTDVFLLLVHHFDKIAAAECFMMAGTSKHRKYIPIHDVCSLLSMEERENILALHALSGCDTTSFLAGEPR